MDLISVIVPIHNAERYLSRCIKSICQQTYTKLQIILVDDASTDKSGEICEKYKLIDERIEVLHINFRGGGRKSKKYWAEYSCWKIRFVCGC